MKELYEKAKRREIDYMPAPWQSMSGVTQIGSYEELYFFRIEGAEIDQEPVKSGIYYCDKASVEFDRMIEEAKRKRNANKKSR